MYTSPKGERRSRKLPVRVMAGAVILTAAIVFLTVCPVHLRPTTGHSHLDRAMAYGLLGFLIALALRRRPVVAVMAIMALAVGLEAVQLLVPGRDARFEDGLVKACAGVVGVFAGYQTFPLRRWLQSKVGWRWVLPAAPAES